MIKRKPVPGSSAARLQLKAFVYDAPREFLMREFQLVLPAEGQYDEQTPLSGRLLAYTSFVFGRDGYKRVFVTQWKEDDDTSKVRQKLSDSKNYIAISYSWGADSERFPLYLSTVSCKLDEEDNVVMDHEPERNGYVWITANLRSFLIEMRRRRERRFMWIDAI